MKVLRQFSLLLASIMLVSTAQADDKLSDIEKRMVGLWECHIDHAYNSPELYVQQLYGDRTMKLYVTKEQSEKAVKEREEFDKLLVNLTKELQESLRATRTKAENELGMGEHWVSASWLVTADSVYTQRQGDEAVDDHIVDPKVQFQQNGEMWLNYPKPDPAAKCRKLDALPEKYKW